MIKGIKGGLSHARKDKIKIQFEIEFKHLNNLSNDLIDQFISIKWDRGKYKGESSTFKVHKHSISPDNKMIIKGNELTSQESTPVYSSEIINNILNNKELSQHSSTSSLTKKQSKMLIGNKIDGSNNMIGGEGFAAICNEKIQMKITLFSDTIHNKQDYSLQTNYEQKLFGISLLNKSHSTLASTYLDLSNYIDCNRSSLISIPFPSSTPSQASLNISIKAKYLKYNDKKIQTITQDTFSNKDFIGNFGDISHNVNFNSGNNNCGNKLLEIHGNIFYVIKHIIPKDHNINLCDNPLNDNFHTETNTYSIVTDDEDDDIPTEDPFIVSPQKDNAILVENQNLHCQMKDLNAKLTMKDVEYKDSQRINEFNLKEIGKLKSFVDECRNKVLEYEEHAHRAETKQKFIKHQLKLERFEIKKILERSTTNNNNNNNNNVNNNNNNINAPRDCKTQINNINLTIENNDLKHHIDELSQSVCEKEEKITNLSDKLSNLERNNNILTCSLESQKENYKKVLSDLTEFEFKYEKDKNTPSSQSSSPTSSPNSFSRVLSPVLIQRKKHETNLVKDDNEVVPIEKKDENTINNQNSNNVTNTNNNQTNHHHITPQQIIGFFEHINTIISTNYPSILHNPLIGWLFALFFFLMFFYKSITGC